MNKERGIVSHMMLMLALGIGILTLPISIPVVIWKNLWGYADRFAGLPGIKQGGGAVSGIVAFLYVAVLVGAVGAIAVPSSGYDIGFGDSRSDSGASSPATTAASISTDNPTPSNTTESVTATRTATAKTTLTPTAVPTPTPSPTATRTPSPTPTPTATPATGEYRGFDNEDELRRARYEVFMRGFQNLSKNTTRMSGTNYTINASNKSATFYWTTNKSNQSRINNEWQQAMAHYAGLSESVREQDHLPVAMIPDRLNFVTLTQEGEVYRRSHVDYMSAWRFTMNVSSAAQYMLLYYYHAEKGPGHPDYESTPTPTEAKTAS